MLNINEKHKKALMIIMKLFQESGVSDNWMIAGGVAQKINGLSIDTQDIDILTDTPTALLMDKALGGYCTQAMETSGTQKFHSTFGRYMILDVPIEIAGNLLIRGQVQYSMRVTPYMLGYCKRIEMAGKVHIEPLEESLIADLILERFERVGKIITALKNREINWDYIRERINSSDKPQLLMEIINDAIK